VPREIFADTHETTKPRHRPLTTIFEEVDCWMVREEQRRAHIRPHVLIVSDDPSLVEFLNEGLTFAGFWTSVIASGLQTLEVFRLRRFDLIVIDAQLSGFDSLELIRRLRGTSDRTSGEGARSDAPIVLVAENKTDPVVEGARTSGADQVLLAPLELEIVAQNLHQLFATWRENHPDTPLADDAALAPAPR